MALRPATKTARRVGAALRKAGIPTGYRYAQTGYTTHDGTRITEPGVDITTKGRNPLTRQDEDLDHVQVHLVVPEPVRFEAEAALSARVIDVLTAARFPARRHRGHVVVDVPDESAAEPDWDAQAQPQRPVRLDGSGQTRRLVIEAPARCADRGDGCTHPGHEPGGWRKSRELPEGTSIDYARTIMERHAAQFPASGPYRLAEYVSTVEYTREIL